MHRSDGFVGVPIELSHEQRRTLAIWSRPRMIEALGTTRAESHRELHHTQKLADRWSEYLRLKETEDLMYN